MVIQTNFPNTQIKINVQEILKKVSDPLTDEEIENILGKRAKNKIISYSELQDFQFIEQLLPNQYDYIIILIEQTKNIGHWIGILRYIDSNDLKNTIEIFDSYGKPLIGTLDKIKGIIKIEQSRQYITDLIDDAILKNYKIVQNRIQFQKYGDNINTCGRYVIARIVSVMKLKMNLKEFQDFLIYQDAKFKKGFDFVIGIFI